MKEGAFAADNDEPQSTTASHRLAKKPVATEPRLKQSSLHIGKPPITIAGP